MTVRSAPTISAKSVLLIINRSDCVIPGPPFRGILSPPETSIYVYVTNASTGEQEGGKGGTETGDDPVPRAQDRGEWVVTT